MSDAELVAAFEDTTLPVAAFTHATHVRTAWVYVREHGMPRALTTFPTALKRFALAKGATGLYHETITWAFLLVIAERVRQTPTAEWSTFGSAHADLLQWRPSVLDRYYTHETLWSAAAREAFVMPDRLREET